jgi:hypothetical protein
MAATTETQNGANIRALAMTIQPASGGLTIAQCELELTDYKDSAGVNALPATWDDPLVADKDGDVVLASTPFTVVGHASLPDITA